MIPEINKISSLNLFRCNSIPDWSKKEKYVDIKTLPSIWFDKKNRLNKEDINIEDIIK